MTEPKRMSIALTGENQKSLDFLTRSQDISATEAIRRAIATEAFFRQQIEKGEAILIERPNGERIQLVFR